MPSALVVEDAESSREALSELLRQSGFTSLTTANSVSEGRAAIQSAMFDLVLLDLALPDGNGMDLLKDLEQQPDAEVVVITGFGTIDSAVEAMRGGAIDYLTKPLDLKRLQNILAKVRRTLKLRAEVDVLQRELRRAGRFGQMIGSSPAMQAVYDLITRVAGTSSTVLLTGETGTGKELIAERIHELSGRASKPFLPINCGAVAPNLIESELFGHERGSFTGADRQHRGIFERADGGTLFLDEITEMPSELQVKLLRVLETGTLTRIGADRSMDVDVRVVAASNRSVEKAVEDKKLREDLLYRLNVFPIKAPPLRERGDDVELLANAFLERLNTDAESSKKFSRTALERLRLHSWPGNVRELKNVVERAFIISGETIEPEAIPLEIATPMPTHDGNGFRFDVGVSLAEAERKIVLVTLDRFRGDKKKTAETLGISLKTLYNRLNAYGARKEPRSGGGGSPSVGSERDGP